VAKRLTEAQRALWRVYHRRLARPGLHPRGDEGDGDAETGYSASVPAVRGLRRRGGGQRSDGDAETGG